MMTRARPKKFITVFFVFSFFIQLGMSRLYAKSEFQFSRHPRIKYTINENWKYCPDGIAFGQRYKYRGIQEQTDELWENVSLPHTWNVHDPFDDQPSYRRGISWYRKEIKIPKTMTGKRIYLYFEGVNQIADVYVNTAFVKSHKGGYTAFAVDITDCITFEDKENRNLIAVQVDNSHENTIPPLSVGYALYGGIYRDVWLVAVNPVHIKVTDYASSGVYISTSKASETEAVVNIRGTIVNDSEKSQKIRIVNTIVDCKNQIVNEVASRVTIASGEEKEFEHKHIHIHDPRLWSPKHPYLYSVRTSIFLGNKLVDKINNPLGIRWFAFDHDTGFSLNGKSLQLKGTNRHQDYKGRGHALPNNQHVKDLEWIKKMGANFVRLAHYPQDPIVLETCDRLGLLVWEEIPLVNYMNISDEFLENSKNMIREMIRQHYNHPSIIIWGSMNEILLWNNHGKRIPAAEDSLYLNNVLKYARALDSLLRIEDPRRYTAMAFHNSDSYEKAGIDTIPQIQGYNVYYGWYGGNVNQFGNWLDKKHESNSDNLLFISEYGAGSDRRINAMHPKRFDFSGNWQRHYHESYIRQIKKRKYLAGTAIWNQFDFSQPHTGGSIPHLNQKGMQTWDRKPKDVYYLYKANWNPDPMVYIASRDWKTRISKSLYDQVTNKTSYSKQPFDVYTNLDSVELFCNGESMGIKKTNDIHKATWELELRNGENIILVNGTQNEKLYQDLCKVNCLHLPKSLTEYFETNNKLAINTGFNAQFIDESGLIWLSDQEYHPGNYGYIGGKPEMIQKDLIVRNSGATTPVYNYYLSNIHSYRLDVPDGDYKVELFFAEPDVMTENNRVFNVLVNDQIVFDSLDLYREYGFVSAASRCFNITVFNGTGLNIKFDKIKGDPLLNALSIEKY